MRRWLGRIALLLGSTLVFLGLAEVAVRALGIAPPRWAEPIHLESEDKRAGLDLYPDDPRGALPIDLRDARVRAAWTARGVAGIEARWERTPHAVGLTYDEELCRRAAHGSEPRILAIGDSFTEGQGVAEEDTYPAVLDGAIEGAQVIACGRRGYDLPRIAEWTEQKVAALAPDVVLYAMVLNDVERSAEFHARQRFVDDWILDRRRMLTYGAEPASPWQPRLVALAADRIEGMRVGAETTRWYQDMVGAPNADGWRATVADVVRMREAIVTRGGVLLVAIWPLMVDLDGYPFEAVHATIARDLAAAGITVIDALPAFRGEDAAALWVHPADHHPNDRAHGIFARAIAPAARAALAEAAR